MPAKIVLRDHNPDCPFASHKNPWVWRSVVTRDNPERLKGDKIDLVLWQCMGSLCEATAASKMAEVNRGPEKRKLWKLDGPNIVLDEEN